MTIGRAEDNDVSLRESLTVSRKHCLLSKTDLSWAITDLVCVFVGGFLVSNFILKKKHVQHHFEVRIVVLRLTVSTKLYFHCIHREAVMEFISTTAAFRLTPLKY